MKTRFVFVVLAFVGLAVCGCDSGPRSLIVGKWEAGQAGAKLTAEFTRDGKATLTILGQRIQGTYRLNGDDELEWTLNGTTKKCKVKVTATELELVSEGNTVTYKKV